MITGSETEDTGGSVTGDRIVVDVSTDTVDATGRTLVAYGIGASIAVLLHDPQRGVGGIAHAVLPRFADGSSGNRGKFVDSAVEDLLREVVDAGAGYGDIVGWIVGGATVFELEGLSSGVGEANVEAARETLGSLDVPIEGTAVGGHCGRTVELDVATGETVVRTVDQGARSL